MNDVAKSFKSMVDWVDWMDDESKKGAHGKIADLHVNLAYPDLIMDDTELSIYYRNLCFTSKDTYFTMIDKMKAFNLHKINSLLLKDGYDRRDFSGPVGAVNAWYMPKLNSITLPAGILRQPFFDENWPASMNYGGIGVVAGHELTRGFGDRGVQWDGQGRLCDWMEEKSKEGFKKMAKCVIEEYNKFCPLQNSSCYPQCVNGEQTQEENIADNGGIRAAFKGYREHVSLNGPDPQLPGRLMSRFSHDQLFFLSFARVWCEKPYSHRQPYQELMVDPHTPAKYRVFGAIQNFPEFRAAFNCPAGSKYGPEPGKFCPVWAPQA
ncbi:hypothetical protein AB6A40_000247 [Gnathostoma spinigerum]|uniref:Peptidase M13 C-terminal domain-containing protein n=1 Tax=Gnathostoma spinigerum TaxID=75299 RepID=A0ABD6E1R7_9BILA